MFVPISQIENLTKFKKEIFNGKIYVFEKSSGCKGSENPLGNSTENKGSIEEIITNSCYSSYKLSFYKENFTNSKKNNLNSWLNEIKSR